MKDVVCVVIGATSISATLTRRREPPWTAQRSIDGGGQRVAMMRELLASVPRRGRWRVGLSVLVESPFVQVRRLEGLPPLEERLTTQRVTENASALFLKRDGGLVVAAVHRADDELWGAAFDRDVVNEVVAIARALRFDLRTIAADSRFLDRAQTRPEGSVPAAHIDSTTPLAWTPRSMTLSDRHGFRWFAGASLAAAALAAWIAPTLRDVIDEPRLVRELAANRDLESEARRAVTELKQITHSLDARAEFDANRGRLSELVDAITSKLPESTAVLSLRVDSTHVDMIALSPRATDVLPTLGPLPGARSGRVTGPVSHEMVNGARLQRAAFRFERATPRRR